MAVLTLLYDSEIWTLGSKDLRRIQAAEMKFLKSIKGCTILDKVRNEDIRKELNIFVKRMKFRIGWTTSGVSHTDDYQGPHYTILHVERDRGKAECVDLTKKPEQANGLILGEDDVNPLQGQYVFHF